MAAYLRLESFETHNVYEGSDLIKVDEMICKAVGDEVHPNLWCRNWMNTIGFDLAVGKSWPDLFKEYEGEEDKKVAEVLNFLFENFLNTSYMGR